MTTAWRHGGVRSVSNTEDDNVVAKIRTYPFNLPVFSFSDFWIFEFQIEPHRESWAIRQRPLSKPIYNIYIY
jgi:hypothetical protein